MFVCCHTLNIALALFQKKPNEQEAADSESVDQLFAEKEYSPEEIFPIIKQNSQTRKFKESVDLCIKLNVDPTRGDQMIRGTCVLPAGTGKELKVCVFADGELQP